MARTIPGHGLYLYLYLHLHLQARTIPGVHHDTVRAQEHGGPRDEPDLRHGDGVVGGRGGPRRVYRYRTVLIQCRVLLS